MFLCALALAACSPGQPCFDQSSLVRDGRVLAMRADPPEQYLDLSGATPLQPIEVRALFVIPAYKAYGEYGRAVENDGFNASFALCLPPLVSEVNASPACPAGSFDLGTLPAIPAHDSPLVIDPPLALLQEAAARDPLHGLAGLTLRLQMTVTSPADAGVSVNAVATKDLSFQLAGSPVTLNHALELTGMEQSYDGVHAQLGMALPVNLIVTHFSGLRPQIGPGAGADSAIESYTAYDNQGQLIQLTEHVTYSFYAGNALYFGDPLNGNEAIYGGAPGDVADEPEPGAADPPDGLATIEAVFPGGQGGAFWVVARDGRGGVAWAPFDYVAVDTRFGCENGAGAVQGVKCESVYFGCD